jgi:membrane-bound lytic murein transglycosylase B
MAEPSALILVPPSADLYNGVMWMLPLLVPVLLAGQAELSRPSFTEFLTGIRTEAIARGIRPEIVDSALAGIEEPSAVVIERDRSQAEVIQTLEQYLGQRITAKTVETGRQMLTQYHDLLDEIAATYNVPPPLIVSIWGFESNFGRFTGVRPTIAALATLAFDPRRASLFRRELFDALEILNRGDIDLAHMQGSWAGAMGQTQFMPSSYLRFAEDYDGDGKRDIWATPADIFASIANYMHGSGWTGGATWGREVSVSAEARRGIANEIQRRDGPCQARRDMTTVLPASRWRELGVRTMNGDPLPEDTPNAALVTGESRSFLVYKNYDALLEYNCAHSYAIGVGLLADSLTPGGLPVAKAVSQKSKRTTKRKASRKS